MLLSGCYGVARCCKLVARFALVLLGGFYDVARWMLGVATWLLWCS